MRSSTGIANAIQKFYEKLNDGCSDNRKDTHSKVGEYQWEKSCLSCKWFYLQICSEHNFKITYEEARNRSCSKQLYHASEFYNLED